MNIQDFFLNYGLIILLGALLVFMFWNSSRRMKKQREEQAKKQRETVAGAEVLLQGGLYGTIVSFDPDNLDEPAIVEIAPGVDIRVHSQAILRVITPADDVEVDDEGDEEHGDDKFEQIVDGFHETSPEEAAPAEGETESRDGDNKPSA
ncbi:hypothetical protein GCM10009808_08010 [Microbacterium sediminicola]|uniref:Preprotein translocase subunit YajC n=1 Tax=Microbacterium sediminicola TaxID=415210 RepID=A0ABN2HU88_9MICO